MMKRSTFLKRLGLGIGAIATGGHLLKESQPETLKLPKNNPKDDLIYLGDHDYITKEALNEALLVNKEYYSSKALTFELDGNQLKGVLKDGRA